MSKPMSIEDLRGILVACAGGEDVVTRPDDISEIPFDELGYDSLALIETAARLKLDHGVVISDDEITEVRSPGDLLELINDRIAA
jgi:act minimal PKS acyl carrier protein